MSIGRRITNIPKLARNELVNRNTVLYQALVTEKWVGGIANDMALQVSVGMHDRSGCSQCLQSRHRNILCHIERIRMTYVLKPKITCWVKWIRLTEDTTRQHQSRFVAIRTADYRKLLFPSFGRSPTPWVI